LCVIKYTTMRTHEDVRAGRLTKWEIPGFRAHQGGYILGEQVFCVQEGFAQPAFLEVVEALFSKSFEQDLGENQSRYNPGGLTWDFIIAVYRGCDVNDVVAACVVVYGQSEEMKEGRQYLYLFNVCTDPCMMKKGLARVMLNAVYRLSCAVWKDRLSDFWRGILGFSDSLWLLLTVDTSTQLVVPPLKLVQFYTSCGYVASSGDCIPIKPWESCCGRFVWAVGPHPELKCQMWQEVLLECEHNVEFNPEVLLALQRRPGLRTGIAQCIERLLDRHMTFFIDAPQSYLSQSVDVQPVRPRPSRE
jgi:hypothetical protein